MPSTWVAHCLIHCCWSRRMRNICIRPPISRWRWSRFMPSHSLNWSRGRLKRNWSRTRADRDIWFVDNVMKRNSYWEHAKGLLRQRSHDCGKVKSMGISGCSRVQTMQGERRGQDMNERQDREYFQILLGARYNTATIGVI